MAASRKLMTEIQQVLKKVEEGVQLFDEIWDKVYAASGQNLKEKYEGDLKKEIKKLQRLRDQIKSWISSADVKDKSPLTEARKTIESKMEQFKICEKDTKTKAYSKEGLARSERLDPLEAEKHERRLWINESLEKLGDLINSLEADIEKLSSGKTNKKTRADIALAENRIKKNEWHTQKLEIILRKMDTDDLELSLIDGVKDDVMYYVESAVDDDGAQGVDEEFDIYEELDLGDENDDGDDEEDGAPSSTTSGKKEEEEPTPKVSKAAVAPGSVAAMGIGMQIGKGVSAAKTGGLSVVSPVKASKPVVGVPTPKDAGKSMASAPVAPVAATGTTWASAAQQKAPPSPAVASVPPQPLSQPQTQQQSQSTTAAQVVQSSAAKSQAALVAGSSTPGKGAPPTDNKNVSAAAAAVVSGVTSPFPTGSGSQSSPRPPLHPDHVVAAQLLNQSMLHSPEGVDSESQTGYTPRNAYATHSSFPTQPLTNTECRTLFDRLSADTLFFAFYHQQGSYQQYLAASQLKKQSWRFHKKYMTWFQRHEEPKVKTDDYEEGTYAYFDYEGGWGTRFRSDFKFEFQFLEDELQVSEHD